MTAGVAQGQQSDRQLEERAEELARLDSKDEQIAAEQYEHEALETAEALRDLKQDYHRSRALFGDDHVSLMPMIAMISNRSERRAAVAAGLLVPLFGLGGGRSASFYPTIDTDDEAQTYMRFERRARGLSEAMAGAASALDEPGLREQTRMGEHYTLLARTFDDILRQDVEDGGDHADAASTLRECLADLSVSSASEQTKLQQLDALWRTYELLYEEDEYRRRYTWLLGPMLATPLDSQVGEDLLLGIGSELGDHGWGISVAAGLATRLSDFEQIGWWIAVGLTGELTADAVDTITGVSRWAGGED